MTKELITLLDGQEIGRVFQDRQGTLSFTYNERWRTTPRAYPMSLSMPLALTTHGNAKIEPFLWGLLPDNGVILGGWARRFHVSPRNAFALIGEVGEDCAGAVQFLKPERLETLLTEAAPEIEWLDEHSIAERLKLLQANPSASRIARDTGQFSLAGAQPKTALLLENGRWGVPQGRMPTTHILKPPTADLDGHTENEHFCLELARSVGLPVAESRVQRFEDQVAIVVKRYDRIPMNPGFRRVHQEDACQALGVPPARKYQNDGGPGISDIFSLLKTYSSSPSEDADTFLDAIAYNWLIGGTDAHAKNYSLLLAAENRIRLAPLYDIASILPYKDLNIQKAKFAMNIGGEYRLRHIQLRNWEKLAAELGLDRHKTIARVDQMTEQLTNNISGVEKRMTEEGLNHPIIAQLAAQIADRSKACRLLLAHRHPAKTSH